MVAGLKGIDWAFLEDRAKEINFLGCEVDRFMRRTALGGGKKRPPPLFLGKVAAIQQRGYRRHVDSIGRI